jgi:hypothetical protein
MDVSSAPAALQDLVRRAATGLPETIGVSVELKPPQIGRVLPESDGLVAVATVVGKASVELK